MNCYIFENNIITNQKTLLNLMEELFCIEELLLKITPSSGINILFFAELSVIRFLDMKMKYNSTGSE
jgi:hypothetical protein